MSDYQSQFSGISLLAQVIGKDSLNEVTIPASIIFKSLNNNKTGENAIKTRPGEDLLNRIGKVARDVREDADDVLDSESFKALFEQISQMMGKEVQPRILMAGKTGSGKSSVLNALLGRNVFEIGNIPTTRNNIEEVWETANGDIVVVDVPGFAEADAQKIEGFDYTQNMTRLAELDAHMAIIVVKCDDRALEKESEFLLNWQRHEILRDLPIIVVVNQIDKMKPVRDWSPSAINLKCPVSDKEKNIREFLDYLYGLRAMGDYAARGMILPFSAGESYNDPLQYGVDSLRLKIYEMLPECARTMFARIANLKAIEGERLINYYASAAAAAVFANPIVGSDAILLVPLQIAMILHLGRLHGMTITASVARSILSCLGSTLAGRFVYQQLISFIPVVKNFAGPGLAFSLTFLMGQIVNSMFKNNRLELDASEIKRMAARYSEQELTRRYAEQTGHQS